MKKEISKVDSPSVKFLETSLQSQIDRLNEDNKLLKKESKIT